jgi:preprotein translocase subunit SecE
VSRIVRNSWARRGGASAKESDGVAKKAEAVAPVKREYRIVRYFKEVRTEIQKVVWPSRKNATNLTLIVLGVTATMSVALGLIDWLFAKLFALIIG